jgi:hypothetical protein
MQKSEVAVIPMQKDISELEIIFPKDFLIDDFVKISPIMPFAEESVEYLNALSLALNKNPAIRDYPDIATFAFFCRKANILNLSKLFYSKETVKLGRGIIFHITPSNVPVNFGYSLVCGILSGNLNIVRVPSKKFEQVSIIIEAINYVNQDSKYKSYSSRMVFLRYDRQSSATTFFSNICDIRIIWGGDETINQIRKCHIPPRSFDITFADRYSLCVINADRYINETNPEKIALGFYNDTYLFDQNACTSPHIIIWFGTNENVIGAQSLFWDNLYKIVRLKYEIQPVIAVDKLTSFYNQAAELVNIKRINSPDNLIWRIKLQDLTKDIEKFRCSSGYFSEFHALSLFEISAIVNRKYQTLAYYGFEESELTDFITQMKPTGIDRIVPIGRTMDFSLTWDGFNLIELLSRNIVIMK